ncbi:MAG: winged helix-turn-helix transcriptional regulator [Phycisphaerales bacterium]|nr:winged helix-turn-helix transcriptional regulator [Phycisphaerales bacterium]
MPRPAADMTVFHAVADPTRRAILDLLMEGEKPVKALLAAIRATQSALSQHLAVLFRAGLVTVRAQGRLRIYAISPAPLIEVADWVARYEKFWNERLDNLGTYLDARHAPSPMTPEPPDAD